MNNQCKNCCYCRTDGVCWVLDVDNTPIKKPVNDETCCVKLPEKYRFEKTFPFNYTVHVLINDSRIYSTIHFNDNEKPGSVIYFHSKAKFLKYCDNNYQPPSRSDEIAFHNFITN